MGDKYKPIELDFEFRPTFGNYKAIREVFGCDITRLAERLQIDSRGVAEKELPSPVECLVFFERVSGKPFSRKVKDGDLFSADDHFKMIERLAQCLADFQTIPDEYLDLVKDDPKVAADEKKS